MLQRGRGEATAWQTPVAMGPSLAVASPLHSRSLERATFLAAIVLFLISAMTLALGSHAASYFFFLAAYAFLAAFVTGRLAQDESRRHLVLATLSVATVVWLGYNLYRDARTQASTIVTPARSAETLVLMTEFDRRGTRVLGLSTRLRDQFNETLTSNKLANVRVEAVPL